MRLLATPSSFRTSVLGEKPFQLYTQLACCTRKPEVWELNIGIIHGLDKSTVNRIVLIFMQFTLLPSLPDILRFLFLFLFFFLFLTGFYGEYIFIEL